VRRRCVGSSGSRWRGMNVVPFLGLRELARRHGEREREILGRFWAPGSGCDGPRPSCMGSHMGLIGQSKLGGLDLGCCCHRFSSRPPTPSLERPSSRPRSS
jgi:hypothetical protein